MKINFSKIKQSRIYLIIVVLTFIVYGNGINNEYSLDDNIVVDGVEKVNKGFKAIPEIFTTHHAVDAQQSYDYRPIVSLTFAIEKQFFKKLPDKQTKKEKKKKDKLTQANISHFVNVLLYALTSIVLFNFLQLLFKQYNNLLPLIITLIFIVHPLHTEPVCNIKSRDELMMFLWILLGLLNCLKFSFSGKYKYMIYVIVFVFLALLSKKTALIMFGILPVVMYYSRMNVKKMLIGIGSIVIGMIMVVAMKKGFIDARGIRNIKFLENPLFFEGSFADRIPVGLYCSWFYLKMLLFPKDLSFYYGYNIIPMANWSYFQVWAALLFYIPLGVFGVWKLIKREIIGLGIVLWFGVMLAYLNVLSPVVGIVADRFTYVFSLGFCIVFAYLLIKIFKIDINKENVTPFLPRGFVVAIALVAIVYSGRTLARNSDWHDYLHLYTNDIEHLEESAKAHALISNTLYPIVAKEFKKNPNNQKIQNDIKTMVYHFKEAIRVDSSYATSLNNLGSVYINFYQNYPVAIEYCEKAVLFDTNYVEANFNLAYSFRKIGDYGKAMFHITRVIELNPNYMASYNLYNQIYMDQGNLNGAIMELKKLEKISESPRPIIMNIGNLYSLNNDFLSAVEYFERAYVIDPTDKSLCAHLIKLFSSLGDQEKTQYYTQKYNS